MDTPSLATPELSGSQRAYLFRQDAFLAGIAQRAASLFSDGYEVQAARKPHIFLVFCPKKKGVRPFYWVDLVQGTCTCPFYARQSTEPLMNDGAHVPCKHLVGLPQLVHAQCQDHVRKQRLGRYYRLWAQWRTVATPQLKVVWDALGPICPRATASTAPSPDGRSPKPDGCSPRKETES